ncbi:MAG: O-acetyl-ADP-ribose deacetylase [Chloroflexi bacterium]|nr:O-acetyl-ADP-ribose deacetylase [Chloroflexota bacterium]
MDPRIEIRQGDITHMQVDVIVNAANHTLLGGGGVDGAIHRAAGPRLLASCATLGGCATGEAKITDGYRLPARYVIHTVGPVWHGGRQREDEHLAACYRHSLALAAHHTLTSIAFPAISTGVYRFPLEGATRIALRETNAFLATDSSLQQVIFVCFDARTFEVYRRVAASFSEQLP